MVDHFLCDQRVLKFHITLEQIFPFYNNPASRKMRNGYETHTHTVDEKQNKPFIQIIFNFLALRDVCHYRTLIYVYNS